MIKLVKKFKFEAGHHLPNHPKCGIKHGHSFQLEVSVEGRIRKETGMVIDFHDLKAIVNSYIIEKVDHKYLNDEFEFIPTCENLVVWIWKQLEEPLALSKVRLQRIKLAETSDNYAICYGKGN